MTADLNEGSLALALSHSLYAFQETSAELFKSLAHQPRAGGAHVLPAHLLEHLVTIDEHLAGLVDRANEQAETQTRIDELLKRIRDYDAQWRQDAREAHRWKKILDAAVGEGQRDRVRITQAEAAKLDPDSILAYARRIANYTSVPPHGRARRVEGQAIDWNAIWRLKGAEFPWPTDAKLTSGWLAETLLQKQAALVGETEAIDAAMPTEARERRMPVQMQQRPPAVQDDDSDDGFDIDLL